MTNTFKHGDRVRLNEVARNQLADHAKDHDEVPLYIFGEGTVVDDPANNVSISTADFVTQLMFQFDGIDVLVNWDDDPEPWTNPSTAMSTGLELVKESESV